MKRKLITILALALLAFAAGAETKTLYVTAQGAGLRDGSAWGEAMGSLQEALDAAYVANEPCVIKLKAGLYATTATVMCTNTSPVTVIGGYAGDGETLSAETTIIARDTSSANKGRVMWAKGATLTMQRITLANGRIGSGELAIAGNIYGLCLYANNTALAMTDCVVSNGYHYTRNSRSYCGGGIASVGGSITLDGCLLKDNKIGADADSNRSYGGGLYVSGGTGVTVRTTTFDSNLVNVYYIDCQGGAAALYNVPKVSFTDCVFTNNWIKKSEGYSGRDNGYGGAICAAAGSVTATLAFTNCTFIANGNNSRISSTYGLRGGTLYASGAKQTTTMSKCVFFDNGRRTRGKGVSALYDSGSIYLASGTMNLENVLQAGCEYGDAVENNGGTLTAVNCTFADMAHGYAYRQTSKSASTSFRGCVFAGNTNGLFLISAGNEPAFSYCAADTNISGTACLQTDDLTFVDRRYYHLQSRAGAYVGGWFAGGGFTPSAATSEALDIGAAEDAWANEPQPNYHRANVGYDANTSVATMSDLASDPVVDPAKVQVFAYPVADVAESSVNARCEVASAVGEATANVTVVWDSADRGTGAIGDWANSHPLGALAPWALTSYTIEGLSGTSVYRFFASNSSGSGWSDAKTVDLAKKATTTLDSIIRLTRHTAYVTGTLVDNGGADTTVKLVVARKDGSGEALEFVFDYGNVVTSGTALSFDVTGLEADTDYVFTIKATNSAGDGTASEERHSLSTAPVVRYVTPTGAGLMDGSDWANACQLQAAFDQCLCAGDEIRMLKGVYKDFGLNDPDDPTASRVSGAAGLTVRGGYTGSGDARGDEATVFDRLTTRLPTPYRRHLNVSASTARFEGLVFTNGCIQALATGYSVKITSSTVIFASCTFAKNASPSIGGHSASVAGGAIGTSGGSLTLTNCVFAANSLPCSCDNAYVYGGAIYAVGTTLTADDCRFADNYILSWYKPVLGGAIYLTGNVGSTFRRCVFTGNSIRRKAGENRDYGAGGGAIYIDSGTYAVSHLFEECVFDGNYCAAYYSAGTEAYGGPLRLKGTKQTTALVNCSFTGSGDVPLSGYATREWHGELALDSGKLFLTNCLVESASTNAVRLAGGTFEAVNCTIAGAPFGYGFEVRANVTPVLLNTIVWSNACGLASGAYAANLSATYCDLQDAAPDPENHVISEDPRFRGEVKVQGEGEGAATFLSLQSSAYNLRSSSPCVNAGQNADWMDAATDLAGKARVLNGRVDLGCYERDKRGLALLVK